MTAAELVAALRAESHRRGLDDQTRRFLTLAADRLEYMTQRAKQVARFFKLVDIQSNGCWLWTGAVSAGYGRFTVGSDAKGDKRLMLAHRWVYEYFVGAIPDDLELDHVRDRGCTSSLCVNPEHLEAVTRAENERRKIAARTHCPNGHEWNEENSRYDKKGHRLCHACRLAQDRARRAHQKARALDGGDQ